MAPIQLKDSEQQQSGCLSNIFSRFTRSASSPSTSSSNEKFIYSAVDPMEDLPPYEDIVKVRIDIRNSMKNTGYWLDTVYAKARCQVR